MYATNHFEAAFLNTAREATLSAPAKFYVGLFISNPGEAGAGTEVVYTGYERREITFSEPAYDEGLKADCIKNDSEIIFPTSPADAGTVTHIGIMDSKAVGTGKMWAYAEAREGMTVEADEAPVIVAGELVYYSTGTLSDHYKDAFLNVLRGQAVRGFTPHMALFNGDPNSGGAELSGDNYARIEVAFAAPEEAESGQMVMQNAEAASFNRPSAAWGVWNYTVIYDAPTGGNPVWVMIKTPGKDIRKNHMVIFPANDIKVAVN